MPFGSIAQRVIYRHRRGAIHRARQPLMFIEK